MLNDPAEKRKPTANLTRLERPPRPHVAEVERAVMVATAATGNAATASGNGKQPGGDQFIWNDPDFAILDDRRGARSPSERRLAARGYQADGWPLGPPLVRQPSSHELSAKTAKPGKITKQGALRSFRHSRRRTGSACTSSLVLVVLNVPL
jgi:hypothetical protein